MSRRIAVVGASGPLGRAVVRELRVAGHNVTAASRSGDVRIDATDRDSVRRLLDESKPTTLIYLARPGLESGEYPDEIVDRAVDSFRSFVNTSALCGVQRLVFASSAAVYGTKVQTPRSEGARVIAGSRYAELKLRFETVLSDARHAITGASLRIFNVYGPGFSNSLVNRLVTESIPPPVVFDTESFVRDYIHGLDVARIFRIAVESETLPTPLVNVGTGVGTSNRELLGLLARPPLARRDTTLESFSIADTTILRETWGFTPAIALPSAIGRAELFSTYN